MKKRIAAFDFDGTSIDGNSPVLLVMYLARQKRLTLRVIVKIMMWAAAYTLHLPQSEAWVRGLVFTAFEGESKDVTDAYLSDFYDKVILGQDRFRYQCDEVMRKLHDADIEVLCVSATFEPIVRRACELHPIDASLSTTMCCDEHGCYTTQVLGECVEGDEKVAAINAYANARYGEGNWELTYAFGDHYSDIPMLEHALHPVAVNPDSTLKRRARKDGWDIVAWSNQK